MFYGMHRHAGSIIDFIVSTVALNFQTPGEQMDLNQGRFLPNGRCGYVLKPSYLCSPTSNFNPENTGGGPGHVPTQLTIRVSVSRVIRLHLRFLYQSDYVSDYCSLMVHFCFQ